jgi:hypothetical protein
MFGEVIQAWEPGIFETKGGPKTKEKLQVYLDSRYTIERQI